MAKSRQCKNPECLKFFTPKRKDQVYCVDRCREEHYDILYKRVLEVKKICPVCGIEFPTTKPLIQTYCSPECRGVAQEKTTNGGHLEFTEQSSERMSKLLSDNPEIRTRFADVSKPTELEEKFGGNNKNELNKDNTDALHKRPYPEDEACELCGKVFVYKRRNLIYHHWNDENLSEGLYLCGSCQALAEKIDNGYGEHYLQLKGLEVKRVDEAAQQQEESVKVV